MSHALAPTGEDPVGIEDNRIPVIAETVINPDFLQPINRI
jgi:hypothetical protein